jgi:putative transposase
VLLGALAESSSRFGFKVVHYAAMSNHVHLLCEAESESALMLGMNALMTRLARRLNRLWKRKGSVFAHRYHCRELSTPRECHHGLAYVLGNAAHHGIHVVGGIDPYSSAAWFEGWDPPLGSARPPEWTIPLPRASTWLLREGWEIHGRIPRPIQCVPHASGLPRRAGANLVRKGGIPVPGSSATHRSSDQGRIESPGSRRKAALSTSSSPSRAGGRERW